MNRLLRNLGVIALLPLFGLAFWAAASVASSVLSLDIIGVDVHGLGLTSYAGRSSLRPAPVSAQMLLDAARDVTGYRGGTASATRPVGTSPTAAAAAASPAPTGAPSPKPT